MKAYWWNGSIDPLILDLGPRRRWVVSFTPQPLHPQGKNLRYPFDRRLGRPQNWSGRKDGKKTYQPLQRLKPPNYPVR